MPRIPLVDKSDLPEEYDIIDRQRSKLPERIDSDFWNEQPTVRAFSNNPMMGEAHVTGNTIMWTESGLSDRESECVIMTIAQKLDCELLWHDHVNLSLNFDRLSVSEMQDMSEEKFDRFDEQTRTLLRYVVEYVNKNGAVTDKTHTLLTEYYDEETIVGIVMIAGFYVSLSHEVRALRLQREPFVGWKLDNLSAIE
jgi:alkylhydroperoxidase family enzyme